MLLEAAQNNLIALVDYRAAQARDIARAGVVPLLRQGRRSEENKRQNEENPGHLMAPFIVALLRSNSAAATMSMRDAAHEGRWCSGSDIHVIGPRRYWISEPDRDPSQYGSPHSAPSDAWSYRR